MNYHAVIVSFGLATPSGTVQHHTRHRTMRAAARSLSRGITLSGSRGTMYAGVVTPDGRALSLRQAQGKADDMADGCMDAAVAFYVLDVARKAVAAESGQ
jgi:hypothetical protein